MLILALDISGSATGWALGDLNKLYSYGKIISNVKHSRGKRLHTFGKTLAKLLRKHRPDVVIIEKPFLGRNSGVLVSLSKFVAVAEYEIYHVLGLTVGEDCFVDPRKVKKTLNMKKPKNGKNKHSDNKKLMVHKINSLYGLGLKYVKGKSKRHNDDDIADAVALLHVWKLLREET